jgi:hypothetical protein
VIRQLSTALALCIGAATPATAQLALSTIFSSNNGGDVGGTFFFDLTVTQKTTLYGLDCNFTAAVNSPVGIEFWMTPDTRVGKQLDPNVWTLLPGTGPTSLAAGVDRPTRVDLREPLDLRPGRYGIALIAIGTGHAYRDGAETYSDGFLSIETGEAANGPFRGPLHAPRIWNGRLIYGPKAVKGPYLYAYDDEAGALHGFLLDKKTGAPGQLLGSPFEVSGGGVDVEGNGQTLTSDAKGAYLFAGTDDGLAVLRRLPGGGVEPVAGSPFAGSSDLVGVRAWESGRALGGRARRVRHRSRHRRRDAAQRFTCDRRGGRRGRHRSRQALRLCRQRGRRGDPRLRDRFHRRADSGPELALRLQRHRGAFQPGTGCEGDRARRERLR